MRKILKFTIASSLGLIARLVVHRYRPSIVMITGSVGKTSTKDAVAAVLATRFFVRASEKSFNSEFGVPFTILGVGNPWGNPIAWFSVAKNALALLLLPNHYPKMLVLEVGADRPGDLARIVRMAPPDAVIVTRLPEIPVHVEAYASPDDVREEEFSPAHALPASAPLIVSADDFYALDMAVRTPAHVITYGTAGEALVRVSGMDFYEESGKVVGMRAKASMDGEEGELVIQGSVGLTQLLPAAAALAAASAFSIPLQDAIEALKTYEPPPGRGRLLSGKNDSIIIDDSYNASPAAVEEALATLKTFPHAKRPYSAEATKGRRIAVLGDMLELGRYSVMEHERIGKLACAAADLVISVGIRARAFCASAESTETMLFDSAHAAAAALPGLLREGDVVLVKGSQSVRTERIVEALLANSADLSRLVRQEKAWKRKS